MRAVGGRVFRPRQYAPRLISISADYGRINIQKEEKLVNERFVPVRNLKSVNVPDKTLNLLHNLSEDASSKKARKFHVHVLLDKGDPLRIIVGSITVFHELMQAFKVICETPKEQLSYFAVVLGLGQRG